LLPECFFSFFDLRKEFKKKFPSEGELKDLDLQVMADCILKKNVKFYLFVYFVSLKGMRVDDYMQ